MRGSLTPKEWARITELQDQLIVRFVNHRLAVAQGEEHQARALEMEIDELVREKEDIEAWAALGSA